MSGGGHRKTDSRIVTENTIAKMLREGDKLELGECVGFVILYHDAFIKAVWKKDADRSKTADQMISAAADEVSKIDE